MQKEIKQVAQKICSLTGFGQALHVNDILPDLKELVTLAIAQREDELREGIGEIIEKSWKDTTIPDIKPVDNALSKVLALLNSNKI